MQGYYQRIEKENVISLDLIFVLKMLECGLFIPIAISMIPINPEKLMEEIERIKIETLLNRGQLAKRYEIGRTYINQVRRDKKA